MVWRRWGWLMVGGALLAACGESFISASLRESSTDPVTGIDGGKAKDGGTKVPPPPDSGLILYGDAGELPWIPPDAGAPPDAGPEPEPFDGGQAYPTYPTTEGWTFLGPQDGLPLHLYGVSTDEGGNLWVAGGEDGLYLRRPGATRFERFTMADGLHPYGYMPDGTDAPAPHYLKVIAVTGGPPGTVFVGYQGRPPQPGEWDCENNWDGPVPTPSMYKSGDADKVTLTPTGINVVHYDIFSGPASAPPNEPEGREKLCSVFRIVWDKAADRIWFGANHGFAMGAASYTGDNTCNGNQSCSGVMEHVHPAVNGWKDETRTGTLILLTADYRGVALDPNTHNVFFGGWIRSTLFTFGDNSLGLTDPVRGYWKGQEDSEGKPAFQWDLWPDRVGADPVSRTYPTPSERVDDLVSGAATNGDGTFWVSSSSRGVVHVSSTGQVLEYLRNELVSPNASTVAADPTDNSIWVGAQWGGGLSRIQNGQVLRYGLSVFGEELGNIPVTDIHFDGNGPGRRMYVTFNTMGKKVGALGIYTGP